MKKNNKEMMNPKFRRNVTMEVGMKDSVGELLNYQ